MKKIAFILILFSLGLGDAFAQGSLSFGDEDQGYGGDQGYGDQGQQGQKKGGTGLERKNLSDSMKVDHGDLTTSEKCKTICNMSFSTCYRMKSDRGQCYKEQQECLGKCGGDQEAGFGEDPSGGGGEYGF
ncbi:MAG: hypothetical protein E2O68_04885 [Deltaproteobacteria bacterium]|nr:MAG: hypothetical protein E2O68_04885 [Deltaproteobacteria bacterium]